MSRRLGGVARRRQLRLRWVDAKFLATRMRNRRGGRSVSAPFLRDDYPLGAGRAPAHPSDLSGGGSWKETMTRGEAARENEMVYLEISAAYRTKLRRNSRGVTCFSARNWRLKLARLA